MKEVDLEIIQKLRSFRLSAEPQGSLFLRLSEVFLRQTPSRLSHIREFVLSRELDQLFREAHHLKSASAAIGASAMTETCKQIESVSTSGDLAAAINLLEELEAQFGRFQIMLQQEVSKS